jgi:predicted dehydrogenase
MALNLEELGQVCRAAAARPGLQVMVGFNRRFSPFAEQAARLLAGRGGPLCMNMTVNAGYVPPDHWVQDPVRGGGRIIGEACHFIDLLAFLAGSPVRAVSAMMVGGEAAVREDKMTIGLAFEDGSVGTVNYFANGSGRYPKELLEVFSDRRTLHLDNFRRMTGYGFPGFRKMKRLSQDKGHDAEYAGFLQKVEAGGAPLVPLDDLVNVTLASFAAVTSAREGRSIVLAEEYAAFLADLAEPRGADAETAC